jgi:hypothetical protein
VADKASNRSRTWLHKTSRVTEERMADAEKGNVDQQDQFRSFIVNIDKGKLSFGILQIIFDDFIFY